MEGGTMTCTHCGGEVESPVRPPACIVEADVFCREWCAEQIADFRAREAAEDREFDREYQ